MNDYVALEPIRDDVLWCPHWQRWPLGDADERNPVSSTIEAFAPHDAAAKRAAASRDRHDDGSGINCARDTPMPCRKITSDFSAIGILSRNTQRALDVVMTGRPPNGRHLRRLCRGHRPVLSVVDLICDRRLAVSKRGVGGRAHPRPMTLLVRVCLHEERLRLRDRIFMTERTLIRRHCIVLVRLHRPQDGRAAHEIRKRDFARCQHLRHVAFGRSVEVELAGHLVQHDNMLQIVLLELGDPRAHRLVVEPFDAGVACGDGIVLEIQETLDELLDAAFVADHGYQAVRLFLSWV